MNFAVVVTTRNNLEIKWAVFHLFSEGTWGNLWTELAVTKTDWDSWRIGAATALIPGLPILSNLAYIDEGTISFDPVDLRRECEQLIPEVSKLDVRKLLQSLRDAASAAIEQGGVVDVYFAASGERVGDQRSKKLCG